MVFIGSIFERKFIQLSKIDGAWAVSILMLAAFGLFAPQELSYILQFLLKQVQLSGIYILLSVFAIGYVKATQAEGLIAGLFRQGAAPKMIVIAALMGGLSPFCSCEVIPFIAALLAAGVPLAVVMAFWLSSPLMDPAMFLLTAGVLGFDFAIAKTLAAVALGIGGGAFTAALARFSTLIENPLRGAIAPKSCCASSSGAPYQKLEVEWAFWKHQERKSIFWENLFETGLFLAKWLLLAYILEALMLRYIAADTIAQLLGEQGNAPIILGALVGIPAYLNGYAAVPLLRGLLEQGMAPGAIMSFAIAGGVSSIPAAVAVYALVRLKVFACYIAFGFMGALISGFLWAAFAG